MPQSEQANDGTTTVPVPAGAGAACQVGCGSIVVTRSLARAGPDLLHFAVVFGMVRGGGVWGGWVAGWLDGWVAGQSPARARWYQRQLCGWAQAGAEAEAGLPRLGFCCVCLAGVCMAMRRLQQLALIQHVCLVHGARRLMAAPERRACCLAARSWFQLWCLMRGGAAAAACRCLSATA